MSSVRTELKKDEVFLCLTAGPAEATVVKYLEALIEKLKDGHFEIRRQNPGPNSFPRVYPVYVDAKGDINKQINDFLPHLIAFLERTLQDQKKEDHAKSMEG